MPDEANAASEGETEPQTVSKADYEKVVTENQALEHQRRSVQRELERARTGSARERGLADRFDQLELTMLENFGKLNIEGLDTSEQVKKLKEQSARSVETEKQLSSHGQGIVSAFQAAGVANDQFEQVWLTDDRFDAARKLWGDGSNVEKAQEAVSAVVEAFIKNKEEGKVKTYTEEELTQRLAEEREKVRTQAAGTVDRERGNRPAETQNVAKIRQELADITRRMQNGVDTDVDAKRLRELSLTLAGI